MTAVLARSSVPLSVVRGAAASFPMTLRNPPAPAGNGMPRDNTGATIVAVLAATGVSRALVVDQRDDTNGKFYVSMTGALTGDLPVAGMDPRIVVTITDPQGGVVIVVYPLVSQLP